MQHDAGKTTSSVATPIVPTVTQIPSTLKMSLGMSYVTALGTDDERPDANTIHRMKLKGTWGQYKTRLWHVDVLSRKVVEQILR
jgi:hypothetical protein